ncbi:MAG: cyclic nucleotide-binding domain-containing protein [Actinomycetota bacterium]
MSRRAKLVEHLGAVPLFAACSRTDLKILARHMVEVEVPSGATIVKQGEEGDAFYVVLEGEARVSSKSRASQKTVATLGPGSWFGELAVLDPAPRNATVSASGSIVVGVLGARVFRAVLRDVPTMTEKLLAGMARRLRDADTKLNADVASVRSGSRKPQTRKPGPKARSRRPAAK